MEYGKWKNKNMAEELRTCSNCSREYFLTSDKPGLIHQCHECGAKAETTARVGGNMVWDGKHTSEIEIKPMKDAKRFASKTRRLGAGVTASIIRSKKTAEQELFYNGQWMKDDPLTKD